MATNVKIIFYSTYGHVYRLAEAVAEGARTLSDVEVALYQVPEVIADEVLEQIGAKAARAQFANIPVAKIVDLVSADAVIFGTPTRFGNMCGQMRNYLDQAGGLWMQNKLVGKAAVYSARPGPSMGARRRRLPASTPPCCISA